MDSNTHQALNAGPDSKNLAIGVLSVTAAILLAGLIIVTSRPNEVRASGMGASGGGYTVTVGSDISGDQEFVYVMDGPQAKVAVYRFNAAAGQIDLVDGIKLDELPGDSGRQGAGRRRP